MQRRAADKPSNVRRWMRDPNPSPREAKSVAACRCDRPAIITELEGDRRCVLCGRWERV